MISFIDKQRPTLAYRMLSAFIALAFTSSVMMPPGPVFAQVIAPQTILNLPIPGTMVPTTPVFTPALVKGITIHPENPLEFDFIVGEGDSGLKGEAFKEEARKLIKYFLASLTVPEEDMWVNLSPYEKDRIIPEGFGDTEMGRDLLAQDYILKQLTASLMYPEDELGKKFWDRIYEKAYEQFGTTEIPVNTFNKVWIVPDEAVVYEKDSSAFVIKSRLKVMLESDYEALRNAMSNAESRAVGNTPASPVGGHARSVQDQNDSLELSESIIREIILPEIEREVNEGKTFAQLRQIYNSMILATWYKKTLKDSLLGRVYVDQNKTKGVDVKDKQINQKIYDQYIESFKKGVYSYIKEDYDPATQEMIPRKYFSGGISLSSPVKDPGSAPSSLVKGVQVFALTALLFVTTDLPASFGGQYIDGNTLRVRTIVTETGINSNYTDSDLKKFEEEIQGIPFPPSYIFEIESFRGNTAVPADMLFGIEEQGEEEKSKKSDKPEERKEHPKEMKDWTKMLRSGNQFVLGENRETETGDLTAKHPLLAMVSSPVSGEGKSSSALWVRVLEKKINELALVMGKAKDNILPSELSWRNRFILYMMTTDIGKERLKNLIMSIHDNEYPDKQRISIHKLAKQGKFITDALLEILRKYEKDEARQLITDVMEIISGLGIIESLASIVRNDNRSPDVRIAATRAIGEMIGDPSIFHALIQTFEGYFNRADIIFGKIAGHSINSLLDTLDTDKDPSVRAAIIELFGKLYAPERILPLIDMIPKSEDIRDTVRALSDLYKDRVFHALAKSLDDGDKSVQEAAERARDKICDRKIVKSLIGSFSFEDAPLPGYIQIINVLKIMSVFIFKDLLAALKDDDSIIRGKIAETLGEIQDLRAVKPLIQAILEEGDLRIRERMGSVLLTLLEKTDSVQKELFILSDPDKRKMEELANDEGESDVRKAARLVLEKSSSPISGEGKFRPLKEVFYSVTRHIVLLSVTFGAEVYTLTLDVPKAVADPAPVSRNKILEEIDKVFPGTTIIWGEEWRNGIKQPVIKKLIVIAQNPVAESIEEKMFREKKKDAKIRASRIAESFTEQFEDNYELEVVNNTKSLLALMLDKSQREVRDYRAQTNSKMPYENWGYIKLHESLNTSFVLNRLEQDLEFWEIKLSELAGAENDLKKAFIAFFPDLAKYFYGLVPVIESHSRFLPTNLVFSFVELKRLEEIGDRYIEMAVQLEIKITKIKRKDEKEIEAKFIKERNVLYADAENAALSFRKEFGPGSSRKWDAKREERRNYMMLTSSDQLIQKYKFGAQTYYNISREELSNSSFFIDKLGEDLVFWNNELTNLSTADSETRLEHSSFFLGFARRFYKKILIYQNFTKDFLSRTLPVELKFSNDDLKKWKGIADEYLRMAIKLESTEEPKRNIKITNYSEDADTFESDSPFFSKDGVRIISRAHASAEEALLRSEFVLKEKFVFPKEKKGIDDSAPSPIFEQEDNPDKGKDAPSSPDDSESKASSPVEKSLQIVITAFGLLRGIDDEGIEHRVVIKVDKPPYAYMMEHYMQRGLSITYGEVTINNVKGRAHIIYVNRDFNMSGSKLITLILENAPPGMWDVYGKESRDDILKLRNQIREEKFPGIGAVLKEREVTKERGMNKKIAEVLREGIRRVKETQEKNDGVRTEVRGMREDVKRFIKAYQEALGKEDLKDDNFQKAVDVFMGMQRLDPKEYNLTAGIILSALRLDSSPDVLEFKAPTTVKKRQMTESGSKGSVIYTSFDVFIEDVKSGKIKNGNKLTVYTKIITVEITFDQEDNDLLTKNEMLHIGEGVFLWGGDIERIEWPASSPISEEVQGAMTALVAVGINRKNNNDLIGFMDKMELAPKLKRLTWEILGKMAERGLINNDEETIHAVKKLLKNVNEPKQNIVLNKHYFLYSILDAGAVTPENFKKVNELFENNKKNLLSPFLELQFFINEIINEGMNPSVLNVVLSFHGDAYYAGASNDEAIENSLNYFVLDPLLNLWLAARHIQKDNAQTAQRIIEGLKIIDEKYQLLEPTPRQTNDKQHGYDSYFSYLAADFLVVDPINRMSPVGSFTRVKNALQKLTKIVNGVKHTVIVMDKKYYPKPTSDDMPVIYEFLEEEDEYKYIFHIYTRENGSALTLADSALDKKELWETFGMKEKLKFFNLRREIRKNASSPLGEGVEKPLSAEAVNAHRNLTNAGIDLDVRADLDAFIFNMKLLPVLEDLTWKVLGEMALQGLVNNDAKTTVDIKRLLKNLNKPEQYGRPRGIDKYLFLISALDTGVVTKENLERVSKLYEDNQGESIHPFFDLQMFADDVFAEEAIRKPILNIVFHFRNDVYYSGLSRPGNSFLLTKHVWDPLRDLGKAAGDAIADLKIIEGLEIINKKSWKSDGISDEGTGIQMAYYAYFSGLKDQWSSEDRWNPVKLANEIASSPISKDVYSRTRTAGVLREIKSGEGRVGMTPRGVMAMVELGYRVLVQKGAGEGSRYSDEEYVQVGGIIVPNAEDVWDQADVIIKVKETLPSERKYLRKGLTVYNFNHFSGDKQLTLDLLNSGANIVPFESVIVNGLAELLIEMSRIAGRRAAWHVGETWNESNKDQRTAIREKVWNFDKFDEYFNIPKNIRLDGVKVMVLGGGFAGRETAEMAARMGAEVIMTEISVERRERNNREFEEKKWGQQITVIDDPRGENKFTAKEITEILNGKIDALKKRGLSIKDQEGIQEVFRVFNETDAIINTVYLPRRKAPIVVDKALLSVISPKGEKIIKDISIDQGGGVEFVDESGEVVEKETTHDDPIAIDMFGNKHSRTPNIPGSTPRVASEMLEEATVFLKGKNYLQALLEGYDSAVEKYPELKMGGITDHKLMDEVVAKELDLWDYYAASSPVSEEVRARVVLTAAKINQGNRNDFSSFIIRMGLSPKLNALTWKILGKMAGRGLINNDDEETIRVAKELLENVNEPKQDVTFSALNKHYFLYSILDAGAVTPENFKKVSEFYKKKKKDSLSPFGELKGFFNEIIEGDMDPSILNIILNFHDDAYYSGELGKGIAGVKNSLISFVLLPLLGLWRTARDAEADNLQTVQGIAEGLKILNEKYQLPANVDQRTNDIQYGYYFYFKRLRLDLSRRSRLDPVELANEMVSIKENTKSSPIKVLILDDMSADEIAGNFNGLKIENISIEEVQIVTNRSDGLKALEENTGINLLVIDFQLEDFYNNEKDNGVEFFREAVKRGYLKKHPGIKVIFNSSDASSLNKYIRNLPSENDEDGSFVKLLFGMRVKKDIEITEKVKMTHQTSLKSFMKEFMTVEQEDPSSPIESEEPWEEMPGEELFKLLEEALAMLKKGTDVPSLPTNVAILILTIQMVLPFAEKADAFKSRKSLIAWFSDHQFKFVAWVSGEIDTLVELVEEARESGFLPLIDEEVMRGYEDVKKRNFNWKTEKGISEKKVMIASIKRTILNFQNLVKNKTYKENKEVHTSMRYFKGYLWYLLERNLFEFKDFDISEDGKEIIEKSSSPVELGEKQKILVVDNEINVRRMIREVLTDEGYAEDRVPEASNPDEAKGKLEGVALIILDETMDKEWDGIDFARYVKEKDPEIVIIMVTERHDEGKPKQALAAGVIDRLFEKTVDHDELLEEVKSKVSVSSPIYEGASSQRKDMDKGDRPQTTQEIYRRIFNDEDKKIFKAIKIIMSSIQDEDFGGWYDKNRGDIFVYLSKNLGGEKLEWPLIRPIKELKEILQSHENFRGVTLFSWGGYENKVLIAYRKGAEEDMSDFINDLKEGLRKLNDELKEFEEKMNSSPLTQSANERNIGGISLNSDLLDLQIKRDGNGIPLPIYMQPIEHMHIDGFIPIIINVTPVNLPMLLGLTDQEAPTDSAKETKEGAMDLSFIDKYRNKFWIRNRSIEA